MLPAGWTIDKFSPLEAMGFTWGPDHGLHAMNPFHHTLYIGCSLNVDWPPGDGYL